ncbi:MAG: hypothetical protein RMK19_07990 [Bacteroidia bacterium]|nr:hypothetical protein [Bacteroidia bacterium]MDW8015936.1 hypothetical protein [Bacteroidia bacterium]
MRNLWAFTIGLLLLRAQNVGIGTSAPQRPLHIYGSANPLFIRIQSSGAFGAAGIEFVSDPQGSPNEWRPAYIVSGDNGGFTGRLDFFTNGTGAPNRWGSTHGMTIVRGCVGIGITNPHIGARLHVVGTGTQGVLLPSVSLNQANSWAPLNGPPTDGMIVYNIAISGVGSNRVTPGYYYWQDGRWRRFTENGYSGLILGTLHNAQQDINTNSPGWQYLNAYIDLPPGRWIVFSTQLLRLASGNALPSNQSIWVRTTFAESSTWNGNPYPATADIIGSPLISGVLPPQCIFNILTGQVLIHNQSGGTKRYYYFGHKEPYNGAPGDIRNVGTTLQGENQLFALPAE